MSISQIISSRNSWGSIYAVGQEKELIVKYDIYWLSSLMVQHVVDLVILILDHSQPRFLIEHFLIKKN